MADEPEIRRAYLIRTVGQITTTLAHARRAQNLTQRAMASRCGTTQSSVSEWETGSTGMTTESLIRAAGALGYDVALIPRTSQ